jgi:hypothetical protein
MKRLLTLFLVIGVFGISGQTIEGDDEIIGGLILLKSLEEG